MRPHGDRCGRRVRNAKSGYKNPAKRHLRRFNGLTPDRFYWFLKECEWRFHAAISSGNKGQILYYAF
ncbi:MAG: Mobile element protein [Nitrospira sp.]|jgi:transposase|nr:MAG: Mobile element protein [Nitrospira sp.]